MTNIEVPLWVAIVSQVYGIAKLLIEHGADANEQRMTHLLTPLLYVTEHEYGSH